MRHAALPTTIAVAGTALFGCATQSAAQRHVASLGAPEVRAIELSQPPGSGQPREVRVLVDEPALTPAGIVLRLDATHAIAFAPSVPHAVEPDTGTDLVLLAHHLGRGEEHHQ